MKRDTLMHKSFFRNSKKLVMYFNTLKSSNKNPNFSTYVVEKFLELWALIQKLALILCKDYNAKNWIKSSISNANIFATAGRKIFGDAPSPSRTLESNFQLDPSVGRRLVATWPLCLPLRIWLPRMSKKCFERHFKFCKNLRSQITTHGFYYVSARYKKKMDCDFDYFCNSIDKSKMVLLEVEKNQGVDFSF